MEFQVALTGPPPDPTVFEDALMEIDQMAIHAVHPSGHALQVSAAIEVAELVQLLAQAGCNVTPGQVEVLPALCCGECST